MKYKILHHRFSFYRKWYLSLSDKERCEFVGLWVAERVVIFDKLLKEIERKRDRLNTWH
jgi:hypothetical protein